ncbi:hypothetical protein [Sulfitobacter faviae]|uniref:hypothetical protein n=1 Tax=Sulfitobacter faviae TaxID=1775881 RepID=UPI00398CAA07
MTDRKLCGFDVNGWRDIVAKNWRLVPGDEEELGTIDFVTSCPLSSVVEVGIGDRKEWIGGPQADRAPHGLGGGWGEIGAESRRVSVRALLERRDEDVAKLVACLEGSARGASYNVASIDEGPDGSEALQEHFLEALSVGRYRNGSLIWRPVLAALYAIEKGLVGAEKTVGLVCQNRHGLSVQRLRMRGARGVVAPERRDSAKQFECDWGYEALVHAARTAAIGSEGISSRTAHRAIAKSVGRAALGLQCDPELLRMQNGDWEVIDLSRYDVAHTIAEWPSDLGVHDCDIVLVETLTEGSLRERLFDCVQRVSSTTVHILPADAVARGALLAAQRARDGAPIYFDFLPRLSTIVFGPNGPANFDLLKPEETLDAGRVYKSPNPAGLAIPAGQANVSLYLRKEAAIHPRKATVSIGSPLQEQAAVKLWVEQKPAAGRAKIILEAQALGRSFSVDWDQAEEVTETWEQIINNLETKVSCPKRLVLPCGMQPWQDSERTEGMISLLQSQTRRISPDWDTLALKLGQRPFGQYCISSDGEVPPEVELSDIERLDVLTTKAIETTRMRLRSETGPGTEDNAALKFLTWQFRRCPDEVADWLMDCIETADGKHPFVKFPASWVLIYQGLGRVVKGEVAERRALKLLLSSDIESWVWNRQSAGMAFLLSRSETAPFQIHRKDVKRLVSRTIADFRQNFGEEYTKFNYAPFMLAGLLRWRLKEPAALVVGTDPLASDLYAVIEEAEKDFAGRRRPSANLKRRRDKWAPILRDLKAELLGEGANPDLLLDAYTAGNA